MGLMFYVLLQLRPNWTTRDHEVSFTCGTEWNSGATGIYLGLESNPDLWLHRSTAKCTSKEMGKVYYPQKKSIIAKPK